jgi:hypothetical protein
MADVLSDAGKDDESDGLSIPQQFEWRELDADHEETPDRFVAPIVPSDQPPTPPPPGDDPGDPPDDGDDPPPTSERELIDAIRDLVAASEAQTEVMAGLPQLVADIVREELRKTIYTGEIDASARFIGAVKGTVTLTPETQL